MINRISFLATGNEIIEGEIQDTNGNYFAKTVHELGATIYQHVQVSDNREEISNALHYLLEHSDAVIITGGLGPTSDDNTRYAVAEVTRKDLVFDDTSWQKIEERFKQYNLKLVDSNRQQALFPEGAQIYPNDNGSAPACYLSFGSKHLFMLPGPPPECRPIFENHVINKLQDLAFFDKKEIFRWLTMGLSEGEIAEQIDALAKSKGFDTGFRWCYPYLEIKVIALDAEPDLNVIAQINQLLSPNCVSQDHQDAHQILEKILDESDKKIYVIDEAFVSHPSIISSSINNIPDESFAFKVETNPKISDELIEIGTMTLSFQGYFNHALIYEHEFTVPRRGSKIIQFARAYAAWQLARFIVANPQSTRP